MRKVSRLFDHSPSLRRLLVVAAAGAVFLTVNAPIGAQLTPMTIRGVVAGSYFTPPTISNSPAGSTASATIASHFKGAKVCVDVNNNAVCDAGEVSTTSDAAGGFLLRSLTPGPIVAEVGTAALNAGQPVTRRMSFRAAFEQLAEGASGGGTAVALYSVVVSPISTEVMRMMEADGVIYQTAKERLAARLGVSTTDVLLDPAKLAASDVRKSVLTESVILSNRFALAAKMVDRGDVAAAAEGIEAAAGSPLTMKQAHQAVMNLESIPRYDHIFVIMLENKQTSTIKGSVFAPNINKYLNDNNQFTSYYATGNPSEPNRLAEGAGDDFGITDDSAFNCIPAGTAAVNGPEDLPLPAGLAACTNATNHNIKSKPNLFNAISANGMTWRMYNETQIPGRDWRQDSPSSTTIVAPDHLYPASSPVGAIGTPGLMVRLPSGAYATKHNASISFQNVRSAPEFASSNRTMGGGQWDQALLAAPGTPAGWDIDQLGTDLMSGDVGHLNFLEPDQCDDMHGLTVQGLVAGDPVLKPASDCGGTANIYRSDLYTDYLIKKIQASPIWTNTQKRVAIVIMYDEGTATTGFNSCCGWNPAGKPTSGGGQPLGPLVNNGGTVTAETIVNYRNGNKGHGTSVFGVITNQPFAPRHVVDSDAYSHASFVRTMQDMFGLADPGDAWSYMNRSKYTEPFILANLVNLPEYAGSADTHFDAVRPMNHAFVIPGDYTQKSGFVIPPGIPQVGPDTDQRNPWALK
jgi:phosphoesterase family protein